MDLVRLEESIRLLNRDPFRDELARLIGCAPTESKLKAFAAKHPDKWANMIKIFGSLAGYQEKTTTAETNIYMQINTLPDSELADMLSNTLKQLGGQVIEGAQEPK